MVIRIVQRCSLWRIETFLEWAGAWRRENTWIHKRKFIWKLQKSKTSKGSKSKYKESSKNELCICFLFGVFQNVLVCLFGLVVNLFLQMKIWGPICLVFTLKRLDICPKLANPDHFGHWGSIFNFVESWYKSSFVSTYRLDIVQNWLDQSINGRILVFLGLNSGSVCR